MVNRCVPAASDGLILRDRRTELPGTVRAIVLGVSLHVAERGADRSSHDVTLERMEAATREIRDVDAAPERVRDGTRGVRDVRGERLEAVPCARLRLPREKAGEGL